MKIKHIIGLAIVATTMTTAMVWAAGPKPEELLKSRQGLFETVRFQFGPLGAFAQGASDLPADAQARAENVAALAKILPYAFGPGTESLPTSATKAEAFSQKDKFLDGFKALGTEASKLAELIKVGDPAAIKAQVAAVGKTCKSCHDDYRQKE